MAPNDREKRNVEEADYKVDWAGKFAKVHARSRLSFIKSQTQVLKKNRQNRAARGALIATLISIIVWTVIAKIAI